MRRWIQKLTQRAAQAERRRVLMAGLALAATLFVGRWAWGTFITGPIQTQEKIAREAERKTERTNQKLVAARAARLEVEEWSRASLPANPALAQERYQAYLINLLQSSRIANATIMPGQPTARDGIYFVPFSVQAETDLESFTRFLHAFYASPRLHQVRRLSLNPVERADMGPGIRFSLAIEALAFAELDAGEAKPEGFAARVGPDVQEYRALVERNVLYARGPGGAGLTGNSPEHVVLTAIVHESGRAEADLYDRATNASRRMRLGETHAFGPLTARLLDLGLRDAVVEIDGELWRWKLGDPLSQRAPLSAAAAFERELVKQARGLADSLP